MFLVLQGWEAGCDRRPLPDHQETGQKQKFNELHYTPSTVPGISHKDLTF